MKCPLSDNTVPFEQTYDIDFSNNRCDIELSRQKRDFVDDILRQSPKSHRKELNFSWFSNRRHFFANLPPIYVRSVFKRLIFIILASISLLSSIEGQLVFTYQKIDSDAGLRYDQFNPFLGSDSNGFLWISSAGGPYRFDGQHLKLYQLPENFRSNPVISGSFVEDSLGNVWTSTPTGLIKHNILSDKFKSYPLEKDSSSIFNKFLISYNKTNHSFWMSNGTELIEICANQPEKILKKKKHRSARYLTVEETNTINLLGFPWLLKTGIDRISTNGEITVTPSNDEYINKLTVSGGALDSKGTCWLSTDKGLVSYDLDNDKYLNTYRLPQSTNPKIWSVKPYDSLLIVATQDKGLWFFNPTTKSFISKINTVRNNSSLVSEKSRGIHVTSKNKILSCRSDGGVDIFVPAKASTYEVYDDQEKSIIINDIETDDINRLWIVDRDGKVSAIKDGIFTSKNKGLTNNFNATRSPKLAFSTSGKLWHSRLKKLYTWDNEKEKWTTFKTFNQSIQALYSLSEGILVKCIDTLYRCNNSSCTPILSLPKDQVRFKYIHELKKDIFLYNLGNSNYSVLSLDKNVIHKIDSFKLAGEISATKIFRNSQKHSQSLLSSSDTIYIGTVMELLQLSKNESGTWKITNRFLEGFSCEAIEFDANGNLIVLTNKGLAKQTLTGWEFIRKEHSLPDNLGLANGLAIQADSIIWMGTRSGLAYHARFANSLPKDTSNVYIQNAWINGLPLDLKIINESASLTLERDQEELQLRLGTIGNHDQSAPELFYLIDPLNEDWKSNGTNTLLSVDRLPPGTYTLLAHTIDAAGTKSKTLKLKLEKVGPLWERTWFRVLLFMAIASIGGSIAYLVYRKKLKDQELSYERKLLIQQERERIARELHDDLGGDLSSILFISDIDDEIFENTDREQIVNLSRSALQNMRSIVWTLQEDEVSLASLAEQLDAFMRGRCGAHELVYTSNITVHEMHRSTMLSGITPRNLFLFAKECITNVVKHANASKLHFSIETRRDNYLIISVLDNGTLASTELLIGGNGMKNLSRRAQEMGGKLEVARTNEKKTIISMQIPWPINHRRISNKSY